jgi:uncharacterized protein YcbK (DUF882 family)
MSNSKFSNRAMTNADWKELAPYFKKSEFKNPERMGYEFMQEILAVRKLAGCPMIVSSSYRDPAYNKRVGGAKDSAHTDWPLCNALDIRPRNSVERFAIVRAAIIQGFVRIGIYKDGSLHLDKTEDVRPSHVLWTIVSNPA